MPDGAGGRARVTAGTYARRVNAAADLLEADMPVAGAAHVLADRYGCSVRQGRRYAERAAQVGRVGVPQETTVFTVKLPAGLVARVRQRARESGSTISAVVTQALMEFLDRSGRGRPRR